MWRSAACGLQPFQRRLDACVNANVRSNEPYKIHVKAALRDQPDQPYPPTRTVNYRAATPYNPAYPRIFTLWWPDWGEWNDATAEKLAKLSVFIISLHGYGLDDAGNPDFYGVYNRVRRATRGSFRDTKE